MGRWLVRGWPCRQRRQGAHVPRPARRRVELRRRAPESRLSSRLSRRLPLRRQWRVPVRRALILFALLFPGLALADPMPASGWKVEELPLGLKAPSGLAWENGLVVTDVASGRVVRVAKDGTLTDLTKPLPTGIDVMGQPTGPYKVKVNRHSFLVSQGWPDANAEPAPTDHAILLLANPEEPPRIVSSDFWNPYDFEIVAKPDD